MKHIILFTSILAGFFLCIRPPDLRGQVPAQTVVTGYIIDSETNQPIPFAKIVFDHSNTGTSSDSSGFFRLIDVTGSKKIIISSIGFEPEEVEISVGKNQSIKVLLHGKTIELGEVRVKPAKGRYKNKNNPAVNIIDSVIKHKEDNRSENLDFLAYDKYDKTQFASSNVDDRFINSKALQKFNFVFEILDTTQLNGMKILPIYMKEKMSEYYFQKDPRETKEIVKADKMVNFDAYINREGISHYMNYLYQNINIYDNTILFVTNVFLSPLAATAPAFYRYFIEDTVSVSGVECIKLLFSPRNKEDMMFDGYLYIVTDSSFAVKKIEMSVNKQINQNWVKDVSIVQEFDKIQNLTWVIKSDEIAIDFGLTKNSMGIFGKRTVLLNNYRINQPVPQVVIKGPDLVGLANDAKNTDEFLEKNRPLQLTTSEKGIYTVTDSIKKIPAFKRTADLMFFLAAGYKDFGKVELGPINTFASFNPIEGLRFRIGGRTTTGFSQKINFDSYLAYGFADKKYKYYIGSTYSLTPRNIYQFPVKSVKISLQEETSIPGQELQFIQEDNILMSIKRGINDKLFYNRTLKIEHLNEFENHFSYRLGYSLKQMRPGGSLNFPFFRVAEAYINLRYAPQEKFYEGKQNRTPITNKYPIINFYYNIGLKSFGSDYNFHNLKLNLFKRFYPGILGYTDVILEAGKIFGTVPYPLLYMHRANQTYAFQIASYNLMNFLEFVSDEYVSLNVDHHFNGFIFNKIPLTKRLKLREVISGKILLGNVSKNNNPDYNPDLFQFPADAQGNPITYTLEQKPYIEISAGIDNIFKFFRVDLVKRLTYLNHPNVAEIGLRVKFRFDF